MSKEFKISVLMSVYKKENPEYLLQAIQSMLEQTFLPSEIVLVEDGPLTESLYQTLDSIEQQSKVPIKRIALPKNVGLGLALREGLLHCQYEYVARMDTDDLSVPHRLEWQKNAMIEQKVDIVGGHIAEFIDKPTEIVSLRKVPLEHQAIVNYQRMRSAFNHVTVLFKKSVALAAGNYEDGLYMEDDLLWLNMIDVNAKMSNIDETLCYVRVGAGMFERRGGYKYLKLYQQARYLMYKRKQISYIEYIESIAFQVLVALVPKNVRKYIFLNLLRQKN